MPSIGELYRTERVQWRALTLIIARASYATQAAYRSYLESEARAAINRHRADMDTAEWKMHLAAWQEACAAKVYTAGGDLWAKSLGCDENAIRWFHLIITQDDVGGKPSPNRGLTLAEMETAWKDVGQEIADAWAKLRDAERDAENEAAKSDPPAAGEAAA